jgi:hypothetical protein
MDLETFKTLSNILASSEVLINVDPGDEDSLLESEVNLTSIKTPKQVENLKKIIQRHYEERLVDGANLVDEYRDVQIFDQNNEDELKRIFGTEAVAIDLFWEIAHKVLVVDEESNGTS